MNPEDMERLLGRALRAEVDGVEPDPAALALIRRRIEEEKPMRNRYRAPLIAAVAAGAVVIGGVAVATQFERDPEPPVGPAPTVTTPAPSPTATTPAPSRTPSGAPSSSAAAAGGTVSGVPVYVLNVREGDRTVLVREFRTVPDRGDRVRSAVSALALPPADPDHTTFWRRPSALSVRVTGGGITVDLSADAFASRDVGETTAEASFQQLVWTVTAAAGRDVPVTVLVDGRRGYDAWQLISMNDPTRRDPDLRAPVWIDSPADGATLPRGSQRVTGQGAGFEGTFHYRVTSGSREVTRGNVTGTDVSTGWWTFEIPLRLPAGSYLIAVEADNPATGPDARPARPDTKRITVR